MPNVDGLVELVEETQGASVQVGDDLHHNAPNGGRVHGFEGIRAAAQVEDAKLAQEENESLFGIVGHLLQPVVDVAPLLEDGKARVIDVTALLLVGSIGFSDAFGEFVKPFHEAVELLFSGLDDVLHGLVDAKAGEQHGAVSGGGHDAHFLKAGKTVVCIETCRVQFLGQLRGFHFRTGSENHDGSHFTLVETSLEEQFVPHQPSPRTWEMSARILATWRRGRNSQS